MKCFFALFLFFFSDLVLASEKISQVSLPKLLSVGDNYDGKKIRVTGYLMYTRGFYWLSLYSKGEVIYSSVKLNVEQADVYLNREKPSQLYDITGVFKTCNGYHNCSDEIVVDPKGVSPRH
ncbi:hypothetical protein [Pseudoalteromonas rubra]|uniref:hypothetical protein n=1 Tax=Pseudoalteromonas rubra TaxID=43658 RepID=UPI00026CD9CB|nr:hypothetical protein [Pseudoalteromonas rubra]